MSRDQHGRLINDERLADAQLTLAQHEYQQARARAEREARLRALDVAYKQALGLDPFGALPKALGTAGGAHAPKLANFKGTTRYSR